MHKFVFNMTKEEKLEIVSDYLENNKYGGCYGMELGKPSPICAMLYGIDSDEWCVFDALCSMTLGSGVKTVDEFYESIKDEIK